MVKAMRLGTSFPVRVMRANHHLLPDTRLVLSVSKAQRLPRDYRLFKNEALDHHLVRRLAAVAYLHQGKTQQVEAAPEVGVMYLLIVLGQTYAPDPVDRAGFHQNA